MIVTVHSSLTRGVSILQARLSSQVDKRAVAVIAVLIALACHAFAVVSVEAQIGVQQIKLHTGSCPCLQPGIEFVKDAARVITERSTPVSAAAPCRHDTYK